MRLFIAEKPSVAKAIAAELGHAQNKGSSIECGRDLVTWCFGHLLEQAAPHDYDASLKSWSMAPLPIVPQTWKLLPRIGKDKTRADAERQLAVIRGLLDRCEVVVNAGDPDREGQLLVDEVLEYFDNRKPVRRLWLAAQDSASVRKALKSIQDNAKFQPLKNTALGRQRADWLVGMNLTRAYTLRNQQAGNKGVLTVGRVQSPTLALVVARDRAIEAFKPQAYFTVSADIEHANGRFRAKWKPAAGAPGVDAEGRLTSKGLADALVSKITGKLGQVVRAEKKGERQAPPKMFALSTLTIKACAKFGFTAEQVLAAAQSLYETHKLTSYPRTDCEYMPESQLADRASILAAIRANRPDLAGLVDGADQSRRSKVWNDAKVTAHHGIAPTVQRADTSGLTKVEAAIYDMIVRSYLVQFYPDYEYEQSTIEVGVEKEAFVASGRVPTQEGWKAIYNFDEEAEADAGKETDDDDVQKLPATQSGDRVKVATAARGDKKTKAPKAFTEGTLIAAMTNIHAFIENPEHKKTLRENAGLGTEATRAAIITMLRDRQFVEAKGKKLVSTAAGRALIDALPAEVKDPGLTAIFEDRLRLVEAGELSVDRFVADQVEFVRARIADAAGAKIAAAPSYPCPSCGTEHQGVLRLVKGTSGPFWGCSRYKEGCKKTADDAGGKPALDASGARLASSSKGNSPAKGALPSLTKGGKPLAAGGTPAPPLSGGKGALPSLTRSKVPPPSGGSQKCPDCGDRGGVLLKRPGASGPFWGCSRYKEGCRVNARDVNGKPDLRSVRR